MDICYYKGNGEFSFQLKCRHLTLMMIADEFCLGRIAEVLECSPNVETLIIDFTNPGRSIMSTPTNADTFRNKFESWKRLTCCIKNIAITAEPSLFEPPLAQRCVRLNDL
ncbi:hypothetical protein MLD38_036965 [Melastoma candidum]|uniref:Uncharacterized protein n=1 Tax=Melastoma candidum TaxID=119954 RepID=A0ACB9LLC9_9MYRT|nr:hypothetical protein MLD38_036965 [Melastoma candidum]